MDLRTTISSTGLATSLFTDDFVYLISTLYKRKLGGFYQTTIVKYPRTDWQQGRNWAQQQIVYRIEVLSQLQSVQEHIDTVKMVLSKDEADWPGTKDYQDDAAKALSARGQPGWPTLPRKERRPQEMSWTDEGIRDMFLAGEINYKPGFFTR